MLSTWDNNQYRTNPYLNTIWNRIEKISKEHFYFIGVKEDNRNSMIEALLTNYVAIPQSKGTAPAYIRLRFLSIKWIL